MAPLFFCRLLALIVFTFATPLLPSALAQNSSLTSWPLHADGLNNVVQWDHYTFEVNGKRLFIFAGEMHYWRLPVPEMWEDILQKIKAAGCNAFTFYGNWAYHAPTPSTIDFASGAHNFTRLFDLAREIGLYVLVRPGPYVNAEANVPLTTFSLSYDNVGLTGSRAVASLCGSPLVGTAALETTTLATPRPGNHICQNSPRLLANTR